MCSLIEWCRVRSEHMDIYWSRLVYCAKTFSFTVILMRRVSSIMTTISEFLSDHRETCACFLRDVMLFHAWHQQVGPKLSSKTEHLFLGFTFCFASQCCALCQNVVNGLRMLVIVLSLMVEGSWKIRLPLLAWLWKTGFSCSWIQFSENTFLLLSPSSK